jgi:phosphopantothenoylcysteine synthetase/decarboxylase
MNKQLRILVTAGNTQTPIDQVRCITNIFSGRTGTRIALEAFHRGHDVCLLTSHPEVIEDQSDGRLPSGPRWHVRPYRTFDDLSKLMENEILSGRYDAVIHVAAVSDYALAGTYSLPSESSFDPNTQAFNSANQPTILLDAAAGKVKSNHQELWLRLIPTPKLVDRIRTPWGFHGTLAKFKLEVGVTENELEVIAQASRRHSQADFIVANTLEGMNSWALIASEQGLCRKSTRQELPTYLIAAVESNWKTRR